MDQYVTQLESVLQRVLSANNTADVKSATDELQKTWYKQPETVPALIRIMQTHEVPQIRQICGVEVRKVLPRFWYESDKPLSEQVMEDIKASLLRDSMKENNDLVRHTVARIISSIASIDLDEGRWNGLLPELSRASQSTDARERETATYVLYALLESDYCKTAAENPLAMFQLLSSTIDDPESLATRVNSVQALCSLSVELSGDEAVAFQQFVPKIVGVLKQCVDASDDKSAILIFENLSELIDSDANLLGSAFSELLQHMLNDYGLNSSVEPELRASALRVVSTAVSYRYKRINRYKLGPELTTKLVQVVAASDPEDEDEDDEDDTLSSSIIALNTLNILATQLPPSQVIAPLLRMLPSLVHTPNPLHHRAAYLAFAETAEGAPEFAASEASTLLPWIIEGLKSENAAVRLAALQALVQIGEISSDETGKHHATLVPLVYGMLDSAPSMKVCRYTCYALGTLLRTIPNMVVSQEYLPHLMPRLLDVVRSNGDLQLKGFVVSTIGGAAEVTGRNFVPYFEETIQALNPFVTIPDTAKVEIEPSSAKLVSEALGTLSRVCCAVGAEMFAPYLDAWMKTALMCLNSEDVNLRELPALYIGDMAEVYKAQFGPYVQHIVPQFSNILGQEEIMFEDIDTDDVDADISDGLKVNTVVCAEKEYSLDCLGALWKYVPVEPYMAPLLTESLDHFKAHLDHFYEQIRLSALTGIWRIYQSFPANQEVQEAAWKGSMEMLETEDDLEVLTSVFAVLAESVEVLGQNAFPTPEIVEAVLNAIFEVVKKTHPAFEDYDDNAEDEEEPGAESSELANQLVQTALELLTAIANIMGAQLAPMFEKIASMLQPYAASQVDADRVTGVGAFADLVVALKGNISPWTGALLQAFITALGDQATGVRSVAAYGVGTLAVHSTDAETIKQSYPQVLPLLAQVLQNTTDGRTIANGAGAVARLAAKYPEALPASLAETIQLVLGVLPLKDAFEEYGVVLPWLASQQELPPSTKQLVEKLWEEHTVAQAKDAVRSVGYLPADDPLGEETTMAAWNVLRQKF